MGLGYMGKAVEVLLCVLQLMLVVFGGRIPEVELIEPLIAGPSSEIREVDSADSYGSPYPYMAAVLHPEKSDRTNKTLKFICGGIIANNYYILTAAHCLVSNDREPLSDTVYIVIGTLNWNDVLLNANNKAIIQKADRIHVHDMYFNPAKYSNDIGIIVVNSEIVFTNKIQPLSLPEETGRPGTLCTVCGWGVNEQREIKTTLQRANVYIINPRRCYEDAKMKSIFDEKQMICSGDGNLGRPCNGDSGSPLICENEIHGLVSISYGKCNTDNNAPVVYTKIIPYLDWVKSIQQIDEAENILPNFTRVLIGGDRNYKYNYSIKNEYSVIVNGIPKVYRTNTRTGSSNGFQNNQENDLRKNIFQNEHIPNDNSDDVGDTRIRDIIDDTLRDIEGNVKDEDYVDDTPNKDISDINIEDINLDKISDDIKIGDINFDDITVGDINIDNIMAKFKKYL